MSENERERALTDIQEARKLVTTLEGRANALVEELGQLSIENERLRQRLAALASAQQESAPSAEVEEIAVACANELMQVGPQICLFPRSRSEAIIARHVAAALRRYAGDGGVTEEQVEAAWDAYVDAVQCTERSAPTMEGLRAALEAAARAKSSEKGGTL